MDKKLGTVDVKSIFSIDIHQICEGQRFLSKKFVAKFVSNLPTNVPNTERHIGSSIFIS